MRTGALEGIRVLDFGRVLAAPVCAMILGDLGAEVIKVERHIGGDDFRHIPPFKDGKNLYFPIFNRNKKGLGIDFRNPESVEVLKRLIKKSDVLVENFRPGTMESMGLSYEEVKKINPRMIYASISGFGQEGPYKDRAAFDWILQAMSGFMSLTGSEETGPMRAGLPITDHMTGVYTTVGILAALHNRTITGQGQRLDMSLFDTVITTLGPSIPNYGCNGIVDKPWGNKDVVTPVNLYKVKDGNVYIHAGSTPLFKRFAKFIGDPALLDPKYDDIATRNNEAEFIDGVIGRWLAPMTAIEAENKLVEAGIPCGAVASVNDLFTNPQVKERNMLINVEVDGVGPVPVAGMPIKMSDTPCTLRYQPCEIGQDNEEILTKLLGYSQEEYQALVEKGLF